MANKLVAKNLVSRAKRNLKKQKNPIQQEVDRLFYWVLSGLEWKMDVDSTTPSKTYTVEIQESFNYDDETTAYLIHAFRYEYKSRYVNRKEFLEVIKKVTEIFNSMENFQASCKINDKLCVSKMIVSMNI